MAFQDRGMRQSSEPGNRGMHYSSVKWIAVPIERHELDAADVDLCRLILLKGRSFGRTLISQAAAGSRPVAKQQFVSSRCIRHVWNS
eukprot:2242971-Amphidinium_carterae.1